MEKVSVVGEDLCLPLHKPHYTTNMLTTIATALLYLILNSLNVNIGEKKGIILYINLN